MLPLVAGALAAGAACVPATRLAQVELELAELRQAVEAREAEPEYELRLQSSTVAIEKNRARLDRIVPPDAQWMLLEFGGSLKWYVDAEVDTVYVVFRELAEDEASVEVTFSTPERQTVHRMRPGETVEHRMEGLDPPRAVALTLHRIRHTDGGPSLGLFSVVPATELP